MKRDKIKLLALLLSLTLAAVPLYGCGQEPAENQEAADQEIADQVVDESQETDESQDSDSEAKPGGEEVPDDGKLQKPEIDYDDP